MALIAPGQTAAWSKLVAVAGPDPPALTSIMGIYTQAIGLILASAVVGAAICTPRAGQRRWMAAPAVGFAALMVLANAAVRLPGRATTATVLCLVLVGLAAVILIRRRQGPLEPLSAGVGIVALVAASLPFISNGRLGLLGPSIDNDTALHLLWAEGLRSARMDALYPVPTGYPLGPHSLADVMAVTGGAPTETAFTGLILAIVPLLAITAAGLVSAEAFWRRAWVGLLSALTYVVAAYYGESSFKEPIMAILLLAGTVHIGQLVPMWTAADRFSRARGLSGVVIVAAAAVYDFSYFAIAWFAAAAVIWWAAEFIRSPRSILRWREGQAQRETVLWVLGVVILGVILLAPIASRLLSFFNEQPSLGTTAIGTTNLGNLIGKLPFAEGLGLWIANDFRHAPGSAFHSGELAAVATAALIYGFWSAIRRRQLLFGATVLGTLLIWWWTNRTQSPYVSAKSLVVFAPGAMGLSLSGLIAKRDGALLHRVALLAIAAALSVVALLSTGDLLTSQTVQPPAAGTELGHFAQIIGARPVLFLGHDDYAAYELRPAAMSAPANTTGSQGDALLRPGYPPNANLAPLDFDSVQPADLDRFPYVITTSADYQSQAPSNFTLVKRDALYELWKRVGPTTPRDVIESPGSAGAVLNCKKPSDRALSQRAGIAAISAQPVLVGGSPLASGVVYNVPMHLGAGKWALSIEYTSSFNLKVSAAGMHDTLPAYLGSQGPFFNAGDLVSDGRRSTTVSIYVTHPSALTGLGLYANVVDIAATRLPDTRRVVPLSRACGQYVDWYRLGAHASRAP